MKAEGWWFFEDAQHQEQKQTSASIAFEPEYFVAWDDGDQRMVFAPFLRWDLQDDERSHVDVREFYWQRSFKSVELIVGIKRLFWGVTELRHLVDVINQTDRVEDIDGEEKLGQPLIQLTLLKNWGTVDLFVLPYFREQTYPGVSGRPRAPLVVDTNNPVYESSAKQRHLDYSIRWSHILRDWDIGLAYFAGTSREPRLLPSVTTSGQPILTPHYDQIDQLSLDLQTTKGSWLLKLETIYRNSSVGSSRSATGGFEYSFVGLRSSSVDLGLLVEYLYDDGMIPGLEAAFDNDIFFGTRLAFNDIQSTQILVGASFDLDQDSKFFSIEASRRIGQSWKGELEVRVFDSTVLTDPFFALRKDNYARVIVSKFF